MAGTVVAKSRVADVDLADTELDEAKTTLETALADATSAGSEVNKLDRKRRRSTSSKSRTPDISSGQAPAPDASSDATPAIDA